MMFFLLENNLGTIRADFARSEHHNLGKINHNIDSGQSIACQGEGCVLDFYRKITNVFEKIEKKNEKILEKKNQC